MSQKITAQMAYLGEVYLEIYPMVIEGGDSRLTVDRHEQPEFFDVMLRPDDWGMNNGNAYREWENQTLEQASQIVSQMVAKYPGIGVEWVNQ